MLVRVACIAALLILGCGPPVPERGSDPSAAMVVAFEPPSEPSSVASVVHIHIASSSLSSGDALLFQGALSDYYLSKVKHGELPDTLAARQISLVSWRVGPELILAPVAPLAPGPYSLAAASGLLAEFQVSQGAPLLARVWPPAGSFGSARFAIYCGDGSSLPSEPSVALEPGEAIAQLTAGVDADRLFAERCLRFELTSELRGDAFLVPPVRLGAWAIDPSPFSGLASEPASPLSCAAPEVALGLGCAAIADDRAVVRTPSAALLWVVHAAGGAFVEVTRHGASFAVRGLSPSSHEHIWGSVHDAAGVALGFDTFVDTSTARARPVLNEVLANPLGPEPQAEWIEIGNDGSLSLELSSYVLQDGGGSTHLPEARLAPHELALLVRNDFVPGASDPAPAPATRLIHLPTLGKSGLSNSGERLALVDSAGQECSVMPALPTKPGQSLARRYLWSLDGDAKAFAYGAPTPGASNDVAAAPLMK